MRHHLSIAKFFTLVFLGFRILNASAAAAIPDDFKEDFSLDASVKMPGVDDYAAGRLILATAKASQNDRAVFFEYIKNDSVMTDRLDRDVAATIQSYMDIKSLAEFREKNSVMHGLLTEMRIELREETRTLYSESVTRTIVFSASGEYEVVGGPKRYRTWLPMSEVKNSRPTGCRLMLYRFLRFMQRTVFKENPYDNYNFRI